MRGPGTAPAGMVEHDLREQADEPIDQLLTARSSEVDLTRQAETERFVSRAMPDVAILAAPKVGGIEANRSAQGTFLYDNLMIAANAIEACRQAGVAKAWCSARRASTRARHRSRCTSRRC